MLGDNSILVIAAVGAFVWGGLYYSVIMGKQFLKYAHPNATAEDMNPGAMPFILALLGNTSIVTVLYFLTHHYRFGVENALVLAALCFVCIESLVASSYIFEGRPIQLWLIHGVFHASLQFPVAALFGSLHESAIAVLFLEYLYQCYDKRFLANPEEAVCTFGRPVSRETVGWSMLAIGSVAASLVLKLLVKAAWTHVVPLLDTYGPSNIPHDLVSFLVGAVVALFLFLGQIQHYPFEELPMQQYVSRALILAVQVGAATIFLTCSCHSK